MPYKHRWTEEQLREAVSQAKTIAAVLRVLKSMNVANGSYDTIRADVKRYGIDDSHFIRYSRSSLEERAARFVKLQLIKSDKPAGSSLARKLVFFGIKEPKCEICDIIEWLGKPPPLQADHIDGDRTNNELSNLRILCANCHQQTETWGNKRRL